MNRSTSTFLLVSLDQLYGSRGLRLLFSFLSLKLCKLLRLKLLELSCKLPLSVLPEDSRELLHLLLVGEPLPGVDLLLDFLVPVLEPVNLMVSIEADDWEEYIDGKRLSKER